jgi:hypothetical protein
MKQIVLTVGLGIAFLLTASSAFCADVVGTISDLQGHPVSGVKIAAQDSAGKVVGQAIADAKGHYAIGGLSPNTYDCTLDPLTTGFKGGSAVSYLDSRGLIVDWKVSNTNDATALARQGNKQVLAGDPFGLSMGEFASVVVLGTAAIAAGVVGGYGAAGGFSSSPSSSPTPVGVPPTSSSM